ncbi:hypothetical protein ABIB35_000277 [Arthrobacter sp. UYP6]|uniref:hypothetical protein n=1 Tax=Arthrobacter sp. UYP6 TaxID=1756378 RepID=UPI0033996F6A
MKVTNARSAWGRARFGGGTVALLGAALAIGVLLSAGLVLAGVVGFAMLDFAARYFRLKKAAA